MKFLPHLAIAALLFTAIYQQVILSGLHAEIAGEKAREKTIPTQHGQKISAPPPGETGDEMADPACRENALASLRNDLPAQPASSAREAKIKACYQVLAGGAARAGYEETVRWIAQSKLTAAEKAAFAHHLAEIPNSQETAKWVKWMAENLPTDQFKEPVGKMVGCWTRQDYIAAGEWLSSTPDTAARRASITAYVEAVAEYEPRVATQWALTLPTGPDRTASLITIYQKWPVGDPVGAAEFSLANGLR
jgi:hypothetical protein